MRKFVRTTSAISEEEKEEMNIKAAIAALFASAASILGAVTLMALA